MSVLPCFSKMLERVTYNHIHKYVTENNLLYKKQFGFQSGLSIDHAIVQLDDQVLQSFENDYVTLGFFIDLTKSFDAVDHSIFIGLV